jgi:hypothetical protein
MIPSFLIDLPPVPEELTIEYLWSCCHIDFIARYKKKKEKKLLYPKLSTSQNHNVAFAKASTFFSHHYIETSDKNIKILQELSKKDLEEKHLIINNKIQIEKSKIIPFIEQIQFKPEKFKNLFIELTEQKEIQDDFFSLSPQIMWMTQTFEPNLSCPIFDLRLEQFDIYSNAFNIIVKSIYHNNQIPWKKLIFTHSKHGFPSLNDFLIDFNLQYSVLTDQISYSKEITEKFKKIYENNRNIIIEFTELENLMDTYEFKKAFERLINIIFETQAINEEMADWLDIFFPGIRFEFKKIREQLAVSVKKES